VCINSTWRGRVDKALRHAALPHGAAPVIYEGATVMESTA